MVSRRRKTLKDVAEGKGYIVVEACCGQALPYSTRQREHMILANLPFSGFLSRDL